MVASFHLTTEALKSQYFLNLFCSKLQKITAMAFGSRQPEQKVAVSKNVGMNNLPRPQKTYQAQNLGLFYPDIEEYFILQMQ